MHPLHLLTALLILIQATTFTAKVVSITDGDSITVLTSDNKQIKIRLEGIYCP
ncbi:MAG: hypothetical protein U1C46_03905 [Bacteroidales bacterium]|nr:hypothetical protein [Bacteroidales bacterium]